MKQILNISLLLIASAISSYGYVRQGGTYVKDLSPFNGIPRIDNFNGMECQTASQLGWTGRSFHNCGKAGYTICTFEPNDKIWLDGSGNYYLDGCHNRIIVSQTTTTTQTAAVAQQTTTQTTVSSGWGEAGSFFKELLLTGAQCLPYLIQAKQSGGGYYNDTGYYRQQPIYVERPRAYRDCQPTYQQPAPQPINILVENNSSSVSNVTSITRPVVTQPKPAPVCQTPPRPTTPNCPLPPVTEKPYCPPDPVTGPQKSNNGSGLVFAGTPKEVTPRGVVYGLDNFENRDPASDVNTSATRALARARAPKTVAPSTTPLVVASVAPAAAPIAGRNGRTALRASAPTAAPLANASANPVRTRANAQVQQPAASPIQLEAPDRPAVPAAAPRVAARQPVAAPIAARPNTVTSPARTAAVAPLASAQVRNPVVRQPAMPQQAQPARQPVIVPRAPIAARQSMTQAPVQRIAPPVVRPMVPVVQRVSAPVQRPAMQMAQQVSRPMSAPMNMPRQAQMRGAAMQKRR